jgi:hypothetical protein
MRRKGVQISAAATPTSRKGRPGNNAKYNGWERGIVSEARPGGTRMPYINANGDPIRNKAFAQGDHAKDLAALNKLRSTTKD